MARLARLVVPDVPHHVTQRGNRRQPVFFSESDYRAYRDLAAAACAEQKVSCLAWCLMPNHVHLVLNGPNPQAAQAWAEAENGELGIVSLKLPRTPSQQPCDANAGSLGGALRTIAEPVAEIADFVAVGAAVTGAGAPLAAGAAVVGRISGLVASGAAFSEGDIAGGIGNLAGVVAGPVGRRGFHILNRSFGRPASNAADQLAESVTGRVASYTVCQAARGAN